MVTLKALEAAITQVERLRDHEFTFEAGGMQITLRPLRSSEETEVQRYAQVAWEGAGEDGDTAAYQDFMDKVRLATLAFSIVQLGDTDLRGVEYVETGAQDDQGRPVSIPKWEALRELISTEWTKAFMLQVFSKFGELLERVEISASKLVKFDPADLDEEIERLEKRVAELKEKREERKPPEASTVQKAQRAVANADQRAQAVRDNLRRPSGPQPEQGAAPDPDSVVGEIEDDAPPQAPQAPQQPQEPVSPPQAPEPRGQSPTPAQTPQGRRSAIPQDIPAPERAQEPQATRAPEQEGPSPEVDEQGIELPHDGDSFFDPSDPDAALAAETRRQAMLHQRNLQRMREKKMAAQKAEALGVPTSAELARQRLRAQQEQNRPQATNLDVDPRTAGLRQAANLQDQMIDTGAGRVQRGRPQQPQPQSGPRRDVPAKLHGKDVYKMPTQTLDRPEHRRQHGEPPESPVQVNPAAGGVQDKFRGPGQQ